MECPVCKSELIEGEGKLDQSGDTFLPTKTLTCSNAYCGYKHWDRSHQPAQPYSYVNDAPQVTRG